MSDSTLITRVVLKNYKSIAKCDVRLRPLMFLVGPNGSGKSNFLDALRFVSDALNTSLDHALRDRGGIQEVRRRSGGHPNHFSIGLEFRLPNGEAGEYSFRIGARPQGGYEIQSEECRLSRPVALSAESFYKVQAGKVIATSLSTAPAAAGDRLYLVNVSGLEEFRPVYDALTHMAFYNLNPDRIRDLQSPDAGEVLRRDGGNLASVLGRLERDSPSLKSRIEEYLSKVVPGIRGFEAKPVGPKETIVFRQEVAGSKQPWHFFAANMSDGTLRASASSWHCSSRPMVRRTACRSSGSRNPRSPCTPPRPACCATACVTPAGRPRCSSPVIAPTCSMIRKSAMKRSSR